METNRAKPEFSIMKGSDLPLSGRGLVDLLRAVLSKGVLVRFQAKGFSMSPFIKNNDVVTISPLQGTQPSLGDIIAFAHPETQGLYIHRIVRNKGGFCVTKGDNRSQTEESVPIENILGFVTRVERHGKKIFLGLGPERFLIAFLGQKGLFFPIFLPLWRIFRPFTRRSER